MSRKEFLANSRGLDPQQKRWSNAKPTNCECGRRHSSKTEAKVCRRLRTEVEEAEIPGTMLFQQVRIPLYALAPEDTGIPCYISIDFVIANAGKPIRFIDAKSGKRRSRDWHRGAKALEASWPYIKVEEVDA